MILSGVQKYDFIFRYGLLSLFLLGFIPSVLSAQQADTVRLPVSPDAPEAEITYSAKDSMIYDVKNQKVYLYGNASVAYQSMTLEAGAIVFDWANNTVTAGTSFDSLGNRTGRPAFSDESQEFLADSMRYNFVSRKGIVYHVSTQQSELYLLVDKGKFRVGDEDSGDDNVFCSEKAIFTTCDHPHPHYGIRSTKQKVIPNKLVVVGPSNLEIADVPTPLWLPFGFFPITKGQRSGVIFPRDYEFSPAWGFGLRNLGYYFGLGDYLDLSLTGDIYSRGSWGLTAASAYRRRYKYNGRLSLSYTNRVTDEKGTPSYSLKRDFLVQWNHTQDRSAHPTQNFSASVNLGTGSYLSTNNNDAESVLTNSMSSNLTYSKTFPGKPYSLSAGMSHAQNTRTRAISVTLPTADFRVNKIFPFKRKKKKGKEGWYERIGFTYAAHLENRMTGIDSTFFRKETLEDAQYGLRHSIPVSASFRVLKYFTLTPTVSYTEKWYFKTLQKEFDPTLIFRTDTIYNADSSEIVSINRDTMYGTLNEAFKFKFRSLRELNSSLSLATQVYGTAYFKRGPIRAIRHVAKPSLSVSYRPDYTRDFWGYFDSIQTDTRYEDLETYSYFDGGFMGAPPKGRSALLSFNLNNIVEAKVLNRKDTLGNLKKLRILDNLRLGGSYNFAADSLRLSTINISGNTRIYKDITLNFGAVFDPYTTTSDNRRINTFVWEERKKPLRFTRANLSVITRLDSRKIIGMFTGREPTTSGKLLLEGVNINYEIVVTRSKVDGVDTTRITTNNLSLTGMTINLTKKWNIGVTRIGYDFVAKRLTYPDLSFYRDLHCWETGMSWQPSRGTYSVFIRVKPSALDFINIPFRKSNYDPINGF